MADAPIRVLVAEDDPALREALAVLIRSEEKFELIAAVDDATAAIEAATADHPDVALVDVRMPGGGGQAATRGIKECSPTTRVIALSASDDRATVLEMLEIGAVGYLVKGGSVERILESIERATEGQASLSMEITGEVIEELVGQLSSRRAGEERGRVRRARIENAVRDESAFEMAFQPICELDGQRVIGAEALARFEGPPQRGPEQWFAEASEVGLRGELELAAVERALEHMFELPAGVFLSLNASPETVMEPAFYELLGKAPPESIVVEITEHAEIKDYEVLNEALAELRGIGVRLAVDDAGAGFASLKHILRLAPDFIKLDRTLIEGIASDPSRQALAAGMISFADKAGAKIVAEGVELDDELQALVELGVGYAQGFLFAHPGPLPLPALRA